jgi:hypothetical protein
VMRIAHRWNPYVQQPLEMAEIELTGDAMYWKADQVKVRSQVMRRSADAQCDG